MKNSRGLTSRLSPFAFRFLNCLLVLTLILPWLVGVGQASTTIVVNSTEDVKKGNDGLCTLREAIIAANADKQSGGKPGECAAGSDADTIILPADTYFLTRTDNGNEDACQTGDLDINGDLTIIVVGPGATIDASGITDRVFHILSGSVTVTGVTIKNGGSNVDDGGGIYNGSTLTLNNSTVSGNVASAGGGGIYNSGTLALNNVTIVNNTANNGGGILNDLGTVEFRNTIIAGNGPSDCSGTLSSQGHNLDSDGTCVTDGVNDDITSANPLLGPLQNNGGKTETHALLPDSPAIDAGDDVYCEATDQRGEVRPLDGDNDGQARCDIGAFELRRNNFVLIRAFLNAEGGTTVQGLLDGTTSTTVNLYFYSSDVCAPSDVSPVGVPFPSVDPYIPIQVTTDEHGYFTAEVEALVPPGDVFVNAEAKDLNDNPIGFSNCVSFGSNTSWPFAFSLDDTFVNGTTWIEQYIDKLGQSRWYRFKIEPNSEVVVTLTELEQVAANYDLTIYKDIKEAFLAFLVPEEEDVPLLNAQFAGDAFSGDAFSGDAFSGDAFSGDAFSGDAFSGDAFSGDAFSGDAFSGDAFSGDAFSGDAFSGDAFSGDAFSGDAFSAPVFSGDAFSGDAFSGDAFSAAFSSAQTRSLIGVSAFEGTISEGIFVNTWNNTGEFYVRVRGRNGAFSLNAPFHLEVTVISEVCNDVSDDLPDTSHPATSGNYSTIILTDESRMNLDEVVGPLEAEQSLRDWLDDLADSANGVVVNVGADDRVAAANVQADLNVACPYAKNLVAQAIKNVIDDYRDQNPLEYVVIVGDDEVIPSFRHPDNALLAPESQYSPPVKNSTSSQASLKLDYVLSQDAYGSKFDLSLNNSTYPVPELAVGRLVETPSEIATVINAYLTTNGVVAPQTSLTTGYDFLYDAAVAIRDELAAGTPGPDSDLLTDKAPSDPPDPALWTAQDLREALLPAIGQAPDIAFLAGHFTTNAALAADYVSTMSASEVADSPVDMLNSIFFSAGCHSGYNTVDEHGLNVVDQDGNIIVTKQPDWAQAFASKGATLVAGTGYQYGETDYMEYSERIYLEFSRQLRRSGSVPIGKALMEAKKVYLAQTPQIRGLHEKALLEATVFGLPFLKVDLDGSYEPPTAPQQTPTLNTFDTDPGLALGLQYGDITVESPLNETTVQLTDVDDLSTVWASYLSGTPFGDNNGVATYLGEPALPLEVRDVTVPDTTLRGVGWRGGLYQEKDVIPVTGAPATEVSGVHTPFLTDYFYPVQMWKVNYWDVLDNPNVGITHLMVTPAQHKISSTLTDPQDSTRRQFSDVTLRLYYSNDVTDYSTEEGIRSIPGLSGPPVIVRVSAEPDGGIVTFNILVTSNPAAGVQEVWVTYTDIGDSCPAGSGTFCAWQSLDLTQNPAESTIWTGELDVAEKGIANAADIRFMVQAVNGVGLIGRADNLGKFFVPGVNPAKTNLDVLPLAQNNGDFGTKATFSAKLTDQQNDPIAGQPVTFRLASAAANKSGLESVSGVALTGQNGEAAINLPLRALPGDYEVSAFFAGSATLLPDFAKGGAFTINRQNTEFCHADVETECVLSATLLPDPEADTGIVAVLTDDEGRRLRERTVFFVVEDGTNALSVHTITDWRGRTFLGPVNLPVGEYTINISFVNGTIVLPNNLGYPDEIVELLDDGYNPTSTAGTLTINTPPVANAGGPYTGDEGALITLDGSGSHDPDGHALTHYAWDFGDGNVGSGITDTHTYADNGEYIVTLTVTDPIDASDSETTTATIDNVVPTVDAGDDKIADEGDLVSLLPPATFSDPGSADTHEATIDWGDGNVEPGTIDQIAGTVSGSHAYGDDDIYTVTVIVTDDDAGSGADNTLIIIVSNVAPEVSAVPSQTVQVGEPFDLQVTFTDPGFLDTHEATINWGDGTVISGTVDQAADIISGTHAYSIPDDYTISVVVCDDDGACAYSPPSGPNVIVNPAPNEPPVANAGGPYTADEGATITLDGSQSEDPDEDPSALIYEWDLDYDGVTFDVDTSGVQPMVSFDDDFPTRTIALRVTDSGGLTALDTTGLTVNNVAPTVDAGPDQTVNEGNPVTLATTFSDSGSADTHTATIDWGDGTVETDIVVTGGDVPGSHTYAGFGTFVVTVTVTDDEGDSGSDTLSVTVNSTPQCSLAEPSEMGFWPPAKDFKPVTIIVSDPDGDPLTVEVTGIFQDEPVTKDSSDGIISDPPSDTAQIRVDRDGNGDGRVYHIDFTADDGHGGTCSGEVKVVVVPHDQDDELTPEFIESIDGGRKYNSVTGEGPLF